MFNIHIEVPSGAVSRGYERETEEEAVKVFERNVAQIKPWDGIVCDVVMTEEGKEVKREHIDNGSR
jgi:hypothetical protein